MYFVVVVGCAYLAVLDPMDRRISGGSVCLETGFFLCCTTDHTRDSYRVISTKNSRDRECRVLMTKIDLHRSIEEQEIAPVGCSEPLVIDRDYTSSDMKIVLDYRTLVYDKVPVVGIEDAVKSRDDMSDDLVTGLEILIVNVPSNVLSRECR